VNYFLTKLNNKKIKSKFKAMKFILPYRKAHSSVKRAKKSPTISRTFSEYKPKYNFRDKKSYCCYKHKLWNKKPIIQSLIILF
jgi:hypothetical protein